MSDRRRSRNIQSPVSGGVRLLLLALALAPSLGGQAVAADEGYFIEHVAPLFEAHCVRCHQGEMAKGGLSLAMREALRKGGESGAAVAAGKPQESLLLDYISGDSPEMPKGGPPLSPEQVAAVRRWIEQGAIWPDGLTYRHNGIDRRLTDVHGEVIHALLA